MTIPRIPQLQISDSPLAPFLPSNLSDAEAWYDPTGTVCSHGFIRKHECYLYFPRLALFRFDKTTASVLALVDNDSPKELIHDVYRRNVLPFILHLRGFEVLHASAVHINNQVVAFCARSGTGKTTIAAALAQRGYDTWADDAVMVRMQDNEVWSESLPFSLRLRADAKTHLETAVSNVPRLKNEGRRCCHPGERARLSALVLLQRQPTTRKQTTTSREDPVPGEEFRELLEHGYFFGLANGQRKRTTLQRYLEIFANVQTYRVSLQGGLEHLEASLESIEALIMRATDSGSTQPQGPGAELEVIS